ncbi:MULTISPECIES: RloB domain-containing protein [unclassified Actinobaculum]|uniref:RloB domain-containing protein n=1 Tax=unclassified Actinobaculum TaxID=2609299 RepID=UPI000D5264A0|nr:MULTISPECIES: RloB domain-containing protein [unclassified Actinobaculum]AWE42099.1 hypothetical protein DDD63_04260 [Actinobaculum sp. 313]RTE50653.1 RloB domain-containing protein [Actinobaculum sp. 352]
MARKNKSRPRSVRKGVTPGSRLPREPVFFCAEGLTEVQYVKALLQYRYKDLFVAQPIGRSGLKTSLVNLINSARLEERKWRRSDRHRAIWILCDADENAVHLHELEKWLAESDTHRCAIQSPAIEGWFLQHFDNPARPTTSREALALLQKKWQPYSKGQEIPSWLIEKTEEACRREHEFLRSVPAKVGSSWPPDRVSQLVNFVAYLDQRAEKLRSWRPPTSR